MEDADALDPSDPRLDRPVVHPIVGVIEGMEELVLMPGCMVLNWNGDGRHCRLVSQQQFNVLLRTLLSTRTHYEDRRRRKRRDHWHIGQYWDG
jgi:hypothetical protein